MPLGRAIVGENGRRTLEQAASDGLFFNEAIIQV